MTTLQRQEDLSVFVFDSVDSERYSPSILVTDHPVENGAPVTDNARVEQLVIVITGRVSQTPLAAGVQTGPGRENAALAWLQASQGKLVDVISTRRGVIRNCLITGYPNETGNSLQLPLTVSLKQIRIASADFVKIPAVGSKRPTEKGISGQPDNADAGTQATRQSFAAILTDGVTAGASDLYHYATGQ